MQEGYSADDLTIMDETRAPGRLIEADRDGRGGRDGS